ncbi:MAG: hypothetical protein ACI4SE_07415 [Lachnospiraceae bacterium]
MEDVLEQIMDDAMHGEKCEKECKMLDKTGCLAVGYQDVNVCIPITIKPFGEVGNAETKCVGRPVVIAGCDECPGCPDKVCKFTISQKLCVEVPVVFGARAEAGEASVDCGCAESMGCDQ